MLEQQSVYAAEVTVVLADDEESGRVHGRFFEDPTPTDVMTFPLGGSGQADDPLTGELMVGVEVARRVAAELDRTEREEVLLYVVHGVLHLCGLDDRTAEERAQMRVLERTALQSMGLQPHYFD